MKKRILILFLLASILSLTKLHAATSTDKHVRDSIFGIANTISVDSLRSQFLRGAFQQYIGQEFATEFLDSAIDLCIRKKLHKEEIWALYDYCRHYEYCMDLPKQEQRLSNLKDASYRYKEHAFYYTMWLSVLQARCAMGDTEYAIIQAKEMEKEANRIGYDAGKFISLLALAQAYDFAGQFEKSVKKYLEAQKESPNANDDALVFIHGNLSRIYRKLKNYPLALNELQLQLDALSRISNKSTLTDTFKSVFLEIEIDFCKLFIATEDKENLRKHLKEAQKYYNKNIYHGAYLNYHSLWGTYYKFTEEWDKSLQEIDLALAACRGVEPFNENQILRTKADVLMEMGNYEEAAQAYKTSALQGDSLNQDLMLRHQEAHQMNHKIQKALLEKEEITKRYRYIQVSAGCAILILLIFVIIRASHIRRQLQSSEEETRRAYEKMKSADTMKERFLHNITYEIRIPLNTVVGFSELLSSENNLSNEELEEYSTVVKTNSSKLLLLINNILDLSRLEAGMMRFNVQECDIVQMCREAKMMIQMQTPDAVELTFNTELENLLIQIDSKWFLKLLTSLFTVPVGYVGECRKIEYSLKKLDKRFTIIVKGSPLYQGWKDEQEQSILHNINRIYVEGIGGRYQVLGEPNKKEVVIIFPIA